ncbi:DUF4328 domain-containing protein [Arthrobacter sp. NEB 688]|uniref:DUF4328 domain-containing protein n=1 Tax=Arthrobacter sp. NEB 688 TaxID=904039 RepID=UPI0015654078|nr:DUF4328 domain-containing protein [Arthrobacter sp. NEB 688]QKE83024.1 DUF4328 domain-containing protein [Arthrobacter sp. NEB 688]
MTTGERTMAGAPAGWYDDPQDATRLRRWDGVAWTDAWMARGSGTAGLPTLRPAVGHRAPLPGWHRDPADPTRHRWWDGHAWTTRVVDGPLFLERSRLGSGFGALGRFLAGLLALNALIAVAAVVVALWSRAVVDRWLTDLGSVDPAEAERYDRIYLVLGGVSALVYLGTGVLFLAWLWKACSSDRVDPARLRFAQGWTVGAWFVPFLNLVRPYGIVADLCRGLGERLRGLPRWLVPAWWASFLVMLVADSASRAVGNAADTREPIEALELVRDWVWVDAVNGVVTVVGAVLATVLVLRVTAALGAGEHDVPLPEAPTAA